MSAVAGLASLSAILAPSDFYVTTKSFLKKLLGFFSVAVFCVETGLKGPIYTFKENCPCAFKKIKYIFKTYPNNLQKRVSLWLKIIFKQGDFKM